jgi:hypothetical protein
MYRSAAYQCRKLRIERLEDRRLLAGDPLVGDFNSNDVVDAADYVVWRKTLGSTTQLAADANGNGMVDPVDNVFWRLKFGNSFVSSYKPAAVIVQTTGVTLPDGTMLNVSGSQTQGLQEALNYSAAEGWDMFVLPGTYTLNAHLDVAALQDRAFRLEDVTLNFNPSVTDYGIRFDSTMITDWYWKGGALNAPGATSGLLFQPRTPHPLDGQVYGTIGVVDSRFDFSADIIAGTYDVTMQTTSGPVNDALFHFKDNTRSTVHYIGSGFSPTNVFGAARTDDPMPFDLFSTTGRVTVIPPIGQINMPGPNTIAMVYKPNGHLLSTTGTSTSGLQEAFNYAVANNLDVLVFGRGVRNADPFSQYGYYSVNAPMSIGALNTRTYEMYSVTFNYTPSTGNAMSLSDIVNSNFELTGQIVAVFTDGAGVLIKPTASGVLNSQIRIEHVVGKQTPFATNVVIDPSLQSIENNEFWFHEMNAAYFGITIVNPSATTYFRNNFLRSLHIHAIQHIGLQSGQSETNASRIQSNTLELRVSNAGVGTAPLVAGLQVWGASDYVDLQVRGTSVTYGAKFEPSSANNTLYYSALEASTPYVDYGSNNHFIFGPPTGSGSLLAASTTIPQSSTFESALSFKRDKSSALSAIGSSEELQQLLAFDRIAPIARFETQDDITDAAFATLLSEAGDNGQSAPISALSEEAVNAWPDVLSLAL